MFFTPIYIPYRRYPHHRLHYLPESVYFLVFKLIFHFVLYFNIILFIRPVKKFIFIIYLSI
ncbi:MAG TPA: hypothetical protein DCP02_06515 [Actinobacteria bacterium]|nr:hypothetical protein [Actinomycetota bacterium]